MLCVRAHTFMNRFLPTYTHWLRLASTLLLGVAVSLSMYGQDEEDPDPEEDEDEPEEVEIIKQLAFIEEQFDTASSNVTGTIERLKQPYDVVVSPDGGHLYLASQFDHGISIFARNEIEGTLTFVDDVDEPSIGENALKGVRSIAISPNGEFAYAVSMFAGSNGGSLSSFNRNSTSGALSFIDAIYDEDPGIDGLQGARSVAVSPDGKNLYVAAYEDDKVSVFSRNSETGVASFLGVYEEGDQGVEELSEPHAITVSPDGQFVYVALYTNQIIVFSRDDTNGLLTYVSKLSYLLGENGGQLKGTPRAIAISPDGSFVYVTSWNTDSLTVFARDSDSGELTHENDYKNNIGDTENMDGPYDIVISADGRYVYVAAFSSDSVTSFQRDVSTGELSYFQSILSDGADTWSMNGPLSIAASPDGEHVYVGSGSGDHSLTTFRREVIVDPPEFVVQPITRSIEEGESIAFHALAQGETVSYQWLKNGSIITGETLPVFTINIIAPSDDGDVYSIVASNSGGSVSSDDATLTVLPPIVVEAPIDLTALDISSTTADLVWNDQSNNETSFEIQRRIIGEEFAALVTVLANQTQYSDTSIEASTTYRYRVAAKRNDSYSLWSNDAVIESYDDIPQAPATLNLIEETYNKVSVAWSDRSAVEDGYSIFRRRDELGAIWEEIATTDANANQYTDRTVVPDAIYAYRVRAYNESGTSDYSNSIVALTSSIPVTGISPVSRSVSREDISGYGISVTSTKAWEAVPNEAWLVIISPAGGEGFADESVTYRVLLNESQDERTGIIVVGGLNHTVTQEGSPPFMRIQPVRTELTAVEGAANISIESNIDWVAAESADWIDITAGDTGSDYGTVQLAIDVNDSFNSRSAIVQINDQSHVVDQEGKAEVLEFTANTTTYPKTAGSGQATITANIPWTASVSESWINITSATTGSSNATLIFEIDANELTQSRTTDILVNDIAISITQEATSPFLNLSSDDKSMPNEEGTGEVLIISNTSWTASVSASWITITNTPTGNGGATLRFTVDENKSIQPRTADILVNGIAISISQAASNAFLNLSSNDKSMPSEAGTGEVAIDSNTTWSTATSESWISITSEPAGEGSSTLVFIVAENNATEGRTADIIVNDAAVSISQAAAAPFLNLSSDDKSMASEVGSGEVAIDSNTTWTTATSEPWISITSEPAGVASSMLAFTVAENKAAESRTAKIMVNNAAVSISQAAAPSFLNLNSDYKNMPSQKGTGTVVIDSNAQWTSSVFTSWIHITSPLTGEGNATLFFSIDENKTQNSRSATIQVNGGSISINQASFAISTNLPSPIFDSVNIGSGIGAQLTWTESSTTETGFFIRRAIVGTNDFSDLVELPANTISYFDRTAPRGKALEYRIAAIDNIGRSTEDSITSETLPESNITTIVARVRMGEEEQLAYAHFIIDGNDSLTQTTQGFGPILSRLLSNTVSVNWSSIFGIQFNPTESPVIEYSTQNTLDTYPRGVAALGYINTPEAAIPVGFEITGNITLPILIKGIGPGLTRQHISSGITDPQVLLYRIEANGDNTLISSNNNWETWTGNAAGGIITLEEALSKTNSTQLYKSSKEALIIRDLHPGRYLAILKGNGTEMGMAMLEVYDLR